MVGLFAFSLFHLDNIIVTVSLIGRKVTLDIFILPLTVEK